MKFQTILKPAALLFIAAAVFSAAGCATIIQGGTQEVPFASQPNGATVEVFDMNGMSLWQSTTPAVAVLDKGNGYFTAANYRVVISKKGYRSQELFLRSTMNIWYIAGNFVFGGVVGWLIVDPLTGAMWQLTPETVNAALNENSALQHQEGSIVVMLLDEVPESLRDSLVPITAN